MNIVRMIEAFLEICTIIVFMYQSLCAFDKYLESPTIVQISEKKFEDIIPPR